MSPQFNVTDFSFLEEIAELVIRARRCITYTYALRFYLKGAARQQFFDFLQGTLESSLESLNKKNEEDWESYIDIDVNKKMILADKFFKFKQEVNSLKDTVEKHFSKILGDLEAGMPDVPAGDEDEDIDLGGTNWTCPTCTNENPQKMDKCGICRSLKPAV